MSFSSANPENSEVGFAESRTAGWPPDDGEMGALIREFDWAATPLGPPKTWSSTLRIMTEFLLANRFPLLLWWGPQFIQLYNDAYIPVLGDKHPHAALGKPVSECWSEIYDILKPLIQTPFEGGPSTWMEDIPLEVNRYGFKEETHFTIAYSPVPDETAPHGIGGVLATVHEITQKLVGERRLSALRDLATRPVEAKTAEEACATAAATMARHAKDIPFALLYLSDADDIYAHLAGTAGAENCVAFCPKSIPLRQAGAVWPLNIVREREQIVVIDDLPNRFDRLPAGPWFDSPHSAAILPIQSSAAQHLAGYLIAGISPRLRFDDSYRGFLELAAAQISTAIANARAYDQERKRAEALATLDQAKTQFFSNVSHEFRTPLTLLLGPLEDVLAKPDGMSFETRHQIDVAHRNSLRLLRLVNTLLDFSRIEAGRARALFEPTDVCVFTAELASNFRSAIEHAGLRLTIDIPVLSEPVYVDREMWEKIVLNLLSNAFKFTLSGGISVRLWPIGSQMQLTVSDTGIGIPEDELPRIFERFHRVRSTQGRTHEGTGIGLALVRELVLLHGGEIAVKSQMGKGTVFRIHIPFGKAHLPPDQIGTPRTLVPVAVRPDAFVAEASRWNMPDAASLEPEMEPYLTPLPPLPRDVTHLPQSSETILLADDNADMLEYVRRLLADRYQVLTAADGRQALRMALEHPPDLILADIMMPHLDGFGLLKMLRNDPRTKTVSVIFLSARAGEEAGAEGMAAGADDYLVKPFTARELQSRIAAHLKLARARKDTLATLRESEAWATEEKDAFRAAMNGEPLAVSLGILSHAAVRHMGGEIRCAFYLTDPGGKELHHIVGMPESYAKCIDGFKVGPESLACGLAVHTGQPIITPDIRQDPRWKPWLQMAEEHEYLGCWSFPIETSTGRVVGTFALYFKGPRDATERDLDFAAKLGQAAAIIVSRHQESETRRQSAAQQQSLADAVPLGMYLIDRNFCVRQANPIARRVFGDVSELIGRNFEDLVHAMWRQEFADAMVRIFRHTLETGEPYAVTEQAEYRIDRNAIEYYEWNINRIPMPEGGLGLVCYFRDISERIQAEKVLRQTEKLAVVGRLASSIAHEINNPLEAVTNLLYLAEGSSASPEARNFLAQAQAELARVSNIAIETLRFHRQSTKAAEIGLDEVLDSVVRLHEGRIRNAQIRVERRYRPHESLLCHPNEIRQVIANLIGNAIDAMSSGMPRRMSLRVQKSHDRRDGRPGVRIAIADTGSGMNKITQSRIFEPFFTTKEATGTGLGLWIAYDLVRKHKGTLRVRSQRGDPKHGTVFSIFLPYRKPADIPAPAPRT